MVAQIPRKSLRAAHDVPHLHIYVGSTSREHLPRRIGESRLCLRPPTQTFHPRQILIGAEHIHGTSNRSGMDQHNPELARSYH